MDIIKVVTPINDFDCQSFPIDPNKAYVITDEQLELLNQHRLKWNVVESGGHFVVSLIENNPTEEINEINIREQIATLKQNLADTDYQAIKYAEGQISEQDYAPIKAQRQTWRDQINQLEAQL